MRKKLIAVHILTAVLLCGVFVYANKQSKISKRSLETKEQTPVQKENNFDLAPSLLF